MGGSRSGCQWGGGGGSDTKGITVAEPKQFFKSKMRDEGDDCETKTDIKHLRQIYALLSLHFSDLSPPYTLHGSNSSSLSLSGIQFRCRRTTHIPRD
ncbi:hypothetical protein VNO80_22479 [Phaseolus coccineus]|uniref:Uncharacterized protein n=1 Tax=Phaseolus coccineus TaxID=3886 RepID=A0AAN9M5S3_PHACN